MAHFVLVPGLWLQSSSWEAVSHSLQAHFSNFETESQPVPASVFDTPITLHNPQRHRIPTTA